jgi:hypothetical protein
MHKQYKNMLLAHFSNLERSLYTAATYQYDNSPIAQKIKLETENIDRPNINRPNNFKHRKQIHKQKNMLYQKPLPIIRPIKINKRPILVNPSYDENIV